MCAIRAPSRLGTPPRRASGPPRAAETRRHRAEGRPPRRVVVASVVAAEERPGRRLERRRLEPGHARRRGHRRIPMRVGPGRGRPGRGGARRRGEPLPASGRAPRADAAAGAEGGAGGDAPGRAARRRLLLLPPARVRSGAGIRAGRTAARARGVRGAPPSAGRTAGPRAGACAVLLPGARASYSYAAAGETAGGGRVRSRHGTRRRELEREPRGVGRAPRELPPVVVARGQRRGLVREVHVPDLVPGAESVLRREPTHPLWLKSRANASAVIREDVTTSVAIPPPVEDAIGPRGRAVGRNGARGGEARTPTRAGATCARERRGAQDPDDLEDRKARALEYSQSAR